MIDTNTVTVTIIPQRVEVAMPPMFAAFDRDDGRT